ncbi:MAG: T9SS C-terminal target domain-containing protein [Bacteroidetes bacterium]|nr:MAG: T9SS C-terminal target domain-containing protein [Bacteroidota bacterium]
MLMRSHVLTFASLMFFSLLATGQNYQAVYPDKENCFLMGNDNVICLRIDSLSEATTTILHPSRISLNTGDYCSSPFEGSWIGKEIEIRENGENVFINHADTPVTINTQAIEGEEWVAYEVPGEMEIRATVVAHDLMDFLELTDSVKTIAFQAYDAGGDPLDMEVNEMQVQLSKHHGWVQSLNFYFFPAHQQWYPDMKLRQLSLAGLSEPQTGITNLSWFEVFDFQPGDVLHVLQENGTWIGEYDGEFHTTETRNIFEYLDRMDFDGDSIMYSYVRTRRIHYQWMDSVAITLDTLSQTIRPYADFDKLPLEPGSGNEDTHDAEMYSFFHLIKDEFLVKTNCYNLYYRGEDDCWHALMVDVVPSTNSFYEGLGGPYYPQEAMFGSLVRRELVYYQKDGQTWGTPLDVSSVESFVKPDMVKIYPNPVREAFTLDIDPSLSGEFSLRLVDVNSRNVHQQKVSSGATTINVSHLPPGIYFCIVAGKQGVIHSHKLLVR